MCNKAPDATLAELYDPDIMPAALRKAHTANDKAVDKLYRKGGFIAGPHCKTQKATCKEKSVTNRALERLR